MLPYYSRAPDMIKHLCIALASVLTAYTVSAKNEYEDFKKSFTVFLITYAVLFLLEKLIHKSFNRNSADISSAAPGPLTVKEKLFALLTSFISITLVSTSSPLYPFNLWNDANLFFTVGRGIKSGLVLYRDMYEQKGPALYFIHAFCSLISDRTFTGVWLLETGMCFIFITFAFKTVKLFIKDTDKNNTVFITLPVCALIYVSNMFHLGDSCEELCFPLLTVVLYMSLKALRTDKTLPSYKETLIMGLICGLIFWIKYNLCAFIIGTVVFYLIYAIVTKQIKKMLMSALVFLAGFIIISLPVLIYFISNNALSDLYTSYFYNNIFVYTGISNADKPLLQRVLTGFGHVYRFDYGLLFVLCTSVVSFPFLNKKSSVYLLGTFILMMFATFNAGYSMFYYGFIFMVFTVLFMIPLSALYNDLVNSFSKGRKHVVVPQVVLCILAALVLFSGNRKLTLIGKPYSELPQAQFAEVIGSTPDARIITYDLMDLGFFTASGTQPSNKYFSYLNIINYLPELRESQDELIAEEYFDYIITYSNEYVWDGYSIIMQTEYSIPFADGKFYKYNFYLYGRTG